MLRELVTAVRLLVWLVLAPSFTHQDSGSGSGSGSGQGGPLCIDCGHNIDANCTTDFFHQTITCTVNTTSCGVKTCGNGTGCILHFTEAPTWIFTSACYPGKVLRNECSLEVNDRADDSFPPPVGLHCRCDDIEKCSLDKPLVYVHPSPGGVSSLLPSPILLPSPSPPAPHSGARSYLILILAIGLSILVLLVVVTVIGVIIVLLRRKAKRHRLLPTLPDSNATAFQNLSGEQDLPFQLGHLISRGRFGYVYRTQYEDELVAVKIFSYQNRQSWETERDLFAMESTKHRNVVEYVVSGSWGSGYQLQMFIVTPFYLLGSLNRFLARNAVSWEQACRVIHSVSNGLSHLHAESYTNSSGVVMEKYAVAHRDVKSANILVRGENGDCVIADLGFALILDPAKDDKDMANTGQVGTYRYMAPEVLDARVDLHNTQAFKQIDVYALALVMWEVVWRCNVHEEQSPQDYMMAYEDSVGQRPGIDTMRDIVCTQKLRPQITPSWRNHIGLSSLLDTIEECWDEDPEARLSASNVVLRLKELLDGGPTALTSDHTLSHTFTHSSVIPGNERFWRGEAQESTTDTIGTTDSRPPPYDNRWANTGGSDESFSGSMGLNLDETTV